MINMINHGYIEDYSSYAQSHSQLCEYVDENKYVDCSDAYPQVRYDSSRSERGLSISWKKPSEYQYSMENPETVVSGVKRAFEIHNPHSNIENEHDRKAEIRNLSRCNYAEISKCYNSGCPEYYNNYNIT